MGHFECVSRNANEFLQIFLELIQILVAVVIFRIQMLIKPNPLWWNNFNFVCGCVERMVVRWKKQLAVINNFANEISPQFCYCFHFPVLSPLIGCMHRGYVLLCNSEFKLNFASKIRHFEFMMEFSTFMKISFCALKLIKCHSIDCPHKISARFISLNGTTNPRSFIRIWDQARRRVLSIWFNKLAFSVSIFSLNNIYLSKLRLNFNFSHRRLYENIVSLSATSEQQIMNSVQYWKRKMLLMG